MSAAAQATQMMGVQQAIAPPTNTTNANATSAAEKIVDVFPHIHTFIIAKQPFTTDDINRIILDSRNKSVDATDVQLLRRVFQDAYPITRIHGLPKAPSDDDQKNSLIKILNTYLVELRSDLASKLKKEGDSIILRQRIEHAQGIKQLIDHFSSTKTTFPYHKFREYLDNKAYFDSIDDFESAIKDIEAAVGNEKKVRNLLRKFAKIYMDNPNKRGYVLTMPGIASNDIFEDIDLSTISASPTLANLIRLLLGDMDAVDFTPTINRMRGLMPGGGRAKDHETEINRLFDTLLAKYKVLEQKKNECDTNLAAATSAAATSAATASATATGTAELEEAQRKLKLAEDELKKNRLLKNTSINSKNRTIENLKKTIENASRDIAAANATAAAALAASQAEAAAAQAVAAAEVDGRISAAEAEAIARTEAAAQTAAAAERAQRNEELRIANEGRTRAEAKKNEAFIAEATAINELSTARINEAAVRGAARAEAEAAIRRATEAEAALRSGQGRENEELTRLRGEAEAARQEAASAAAIAGLAATDRAAAEAAAAAAARDRAEAEAAAVAANAKADRVAAERAAAIADREAAVAERTAAAADRAAAEAERRGSGDQVAARRTAEAARDAAVAAQGRAEAAKAIAERAKEEAVAATEEVRTNATAAAAAAATLAADNLKKYTDFILDITRIIGYNNATDLSGIKDIIREKFEESADSDNLIQSLIDTLSIDFNGMDLPKIKEAVLKETRDLKSEYTQFIKDLIRDLGLGNNATPENIKREVVSLKTRLQGVKQSFEERPRAAARETRAEEAGRMARNETRVAIEEAGRTYDTTSRQTRPQPDFTAAQTYGELSRSNAADRQARRDYFATLGSRPSDDILQLRQIRNRRKYAPTGGANQKPKDSLDDYALKIMQNGLNKPLINNSPIVSLLEAFDNTSVQRCNELYIFEQFLSKNLELFDSDVGKEFYKLALPLIPKDSYDFAESCIKLYRICRKLRQKKDIDIDVVYLDTSKYNVLVDTLQQYEVDLYTLAQKVFPTDASISIIFKDSKVYMHPQTDSYTETYVYKDKVFSEENYEFNNELYPLNDSILYLLFIIASYKSFEKDVSTKALKECAKKLRKYSRKHKFKVHKSVKGLLEARKKIDTLDE